jgi:hypothetical protein
MKKILLNITKMDTQYIDTNYVFDEFVKSDDEDYEIETNYDHGYPNKPLIPISVLKDLLDEYEGDIENGGITHIEIDHNEDHCEYEIGLFHLEIGTYVEPEPVDPIQEEINALEARIRELKNSRIVSGNDDDLPF